MLTRTRRTASGRSGFSLVELMVVIVLLGIVMGSVLGVVSRQQRFYRDTREVIEIRGSVRQGIDVLRADLRGVSSIGGDLYPGEMNETSIEFRSTIASTMICSIPAVGGSEFVVPPEGQLASGAILSRWRVPPTVGDSIFIYDNGPDAASTDDGWAPIRRITGVSAILGACVDTPYVSGGDAALTGYRITVTPALSASIQLGTPVRIFRRVRYELYQESDRRWYLGYSECQPAQVPTCSALEPVSGPYLPLLNGGDSGLGLYYFGADGAPTTVPTQVARIDVAVRAQSDQPVQVTGRGPQPLFTDTSRVAVGVRNRS
jgi:prepilin-type N-terminal cleavage/methylation domain-containing protein